MLFVNQDSVRDCNYLHRTVELKPQLLTARFVSSLALNLFNFDRVPLKLLAVDFAIVVPV